MSCTLENFYLYLESKKATKNFQKSYAYSLSTKYGIIDIDVDRTKFNKSGLPYKKAKLFSIFCKFAELDKAKKFLEEVHSGKWNFCSNSWNETLKNFKREMDEIT